MVSATALRAVVALACCWSALATALAAAETADGHTITLGSVSTHATSVSLHKGLKYDPLRDFAAIG